MSHPSGPVIGMDLGGSKVSGILLSPKGHVLARKRRDLPRDIDAQGLIHNLVALAKCLSGASQKAIGIGIGIPGSPRERGRTLPAVPNLPQVGTLALCNYLEKKLGLDVILENDANCFALGELLFGQGRGSPCMVGVTLGTGLGIGIVIDGHIHRGRHWWAGELWDLSLNDDTILEDYLSGQYVATAAGTVTAQDAAISARNGQESAIVAWRAFGTKLAWLLGMIGRLLDPDLFVLGGSLSRAYDIFVGELDEIIPRWPIRVSHDPEEMAMRGVAALTVRPHLATPRRFQAF